MLSNSLINVLTSIMSHPNHPVQSRKKLAKYPTTSSNNCNHKLKRICSSTSYVISSRDEEQELFGAKSEESSNASLDSEKIDKTTSSTGVTCRKFWNCPRLSIRVPDQDIIKEESEYVGSLTTQLCAAETQMQKLMANLKKEEDNSRSKDKEIGRLKRKIKDCETKNKNQEMQRKKDHQQRQHQIDHSEYLYERCMTLEHRIFEMEKFLADYGLVWVGDNDSSKSPELIPNNYIENCYEQIIANIDQLNLAVGKGEVHVQHNEKGNGATFKTPSCMTLRFYKNGMIIQESSLRSYDDPTVVSFLRDILDGYFPSELQENYPNGVPFKVKDHRTQIYAGAYTDFPGQGYRLGKQAHPDNSLLSARTHKSNSTFQRLGHRNPPPKNDTSDSKDPSFMLPSTPRSVRSKAPSQAQSLEMYVLRTQILASHNNICSDTHIQSHMNAELSRNCRKEKRDLATKNTECDLSSREGTRRSKGVLRFPSTGRCYHSSIDRSSSRLSPCRVDSSINRARPRSKSIGIYGGAHSFGHLKSASRIKLKKEINSSNSLKLSDASSDFSTGARTHRVTRAQSRKSVPPVLHQINEPSGKEDELRLKVRSLNGGTIYLVHVSVDESIAQLYQLLDKAMSSSVPRGYKIVISGYSPRRLDQLGVTLREIGITRDSVLHLVND